MHRPASIPRAAVRLSLRSRPLTDGTASLGRLDLLSRGTLLRQTATTVLARLPAHIGEREHAVLLQRLGWPKSAYVVRSIARSQSPGNVVLLEVESEHVTELFSSVGERGTPVAEEVASAPPPRPTWYQPAMPCREHLADQLLLPLFLALAGAIAPFRRRCTRTQVGSSVASCLKLASRCGPVSAGHPIEVDLSPLVNRLPLPLAFRRCTPSQSGPISCVRCWPWSYSSACSACRPDDDAGR